MPILPAAKLEADGEPRAAAAPGLPHAHPPGPLLVVSQGTLPCERQQAQGAERPEAGQAEGARPRSAWCEGLRRVVQPVGCGVCVQGTYSLKVLMEFNRYILKVEINKLRKALTMYKQKRRSDFVLIPFFVSYVRPSLISIETGLT